MANTKIKNTVLDSSVISGQSTVTAASNDLVLIQDVSDSDNLKKALVSDFGTSFAGIDDQSSSNDDQLTITDSAVIINEDSDDVDFRVESNGNANRFFVDGGSNSGEGAVVVGHNASLGQHRVFQVTGTTPDTSGMEMFKYSNDASGPTISFSKSRGGSIGTAASVNDNDVIGTINWFADDGTDTSNYAATIHAEIDGTPGSDDTPGALVFGTTADGANSQTERMRIDSSGNVGIGTTSPSVPLDIVTNLSSDTTTEPNTVLTIATKYASTGANGAAGTGPRLEFQIPDDETNPITGAAIAGIKEAADDSDASAGMAFYISQNDTTLDEAVRIDHDGNVGIGTTSPAGPLHVAGHTSSLASTFESNTGGDTVPVKLKVKANNNATSLEGFEGQAGSTSSDNSLDILGTANIKFKTGATEAMRIDSSGTLCVGSTAGFENERVNIKKTGNNDDAVLALDSDTGDASFYRFVRFYKKNNNSSLGKIDYDNSADSMTLAVESDERYKTITGPADGMNLISKLEPIKYTRPAEGVTDGCGFGAQSYKQAFDDIGAYARGLTVGSDTEKWMLDFSPLVPNLVKAIQELEARIAELEG